MKLVTNKNYVNKVLDAIRIIDARLDFPRNMASFTSVIETLLNKTEKELMYEVVVKLDSDYQFENRMAKGSYYKHLNRVYDIMAKYIGNNVAVLGL